MLSCCHPNSESIPYEIDSLFQIRRFKPVISCSDNAEPAATATKDFLFAVLLTNPFTNSVCSGIPPFPDSLCHRFAGYLLLLMEFHLSFELILLLYEIRSFFSSVKSFWNLFLNFVGLQQIQMHFLCILTKRSCLCHFGNHFLPLVQD